MSHQDVQYHQQRRHNPGFPPSRLLSPAVLQRSELPELIKISHFPRNGTARGDGFRARHKELKVDEPISKLMESSLDSYLANEPLPMTP